MNILPCNNVLRSLQNLNIYYSKIYTTRKLIIHSVLLKNNRMLLNLIHKQIYQRYS